MKRKKINDKKFLRNIIIGIASLLVVAFIINVAPGYKRDKYRDVINLIINEENKTEFLIHDIYVNENGEEYEVDYDAATPYNRYPRKEVVAEPSEEAEEEYEEIESEEDSDIAEE